MSGVAVDRDALLRAGEDFLPGVEALRDLVDTLIAKLETYADAVGDDPPGKEIDKQLGPSVEGSLESLKALREAVQAIIDTITGDKGWVDVYNQTEEGLTDTTTSTGDTDVNVNIR